MGQSHDVMHVAINWFPMLLLIGVWVYFLNRMKSGTWTYTSPAQQEKTEAIKAATKALERIAAALEARHP